MKCGVVLPLLMIHDYAAVDILPETSVNCAKLKPTSKVSLIASITTLPDSSFSLSGHCCPCCSYHHLQL